MKKAFTLAEVMIVLAIIGILVAILLPTAQNLTPDEALMKFQKNNTNLASAIRNLTNSEEYFYNGDFGLDRDNNPITEPKYFCGALAEILTYKKINCSEDNLGYNSSALANLPDILTMEIDGENITDIADCMCKNNLTSGEEIILNDGTIIYTINPYYHFGSLIDGSDKRLFNLCSKEKRYKYICMDIDGLDKGEDPFGYALRADGKMIYGSRAQAWIERKINRKEDEEIVISSIDSCEPIALAITPENDTCVAPPSVVYPSVTPTPTPTPSGCTLAEHCTDCSGLTGECVACESGYSLVSGVCVELTCTPGEHCLACNPSTNLCTTCEDGYVLDGVNCKSGEFTYTYTGTHDKISTSEYTRITLTSGGTFTATSPATATVMALGGGGGGGGSAYDGEAGTYGCSGYNTQSEVVFSTNDSYSVTIGTGGSYGRGSCKYGVDYDGSAGTQTKFGSITASGGGGGYGGWNSGSCRGGSAVTFAGLTYASGRDKGVNSGTGGSGATGKYDNGETTCGYNGKAGASGVVVIMIQK